LLSDQTTSDFDINAGFLVTLEEESRRALLNNISRVREAESFDQLLVDIPEPVWLAVGPSLRASKGWRLTIG
jgi:hypothetical protein